MYFYILILYRLFHCNSFKLNNIFRKQDYFSFLSRSHFRQKVLRVFAVAAQQGRLLSGDVINAEHDVTDAADGRARPPSDWRPASTFRQHTPPPR